MEEEEEEGEEGQAEVTMESAVFTLPWNDDDEEGDEVEDEEADHHSVVVDDEFRLDDSSDEEQPAKRRAAAGAAGPAQSSMHLAAFALFEFGVICLKNVIPSSDAPRLQQAVIGAQRVSRYYRGLLRLRGLEYSGENAQSCRFQECASRSAGRLDVRMPRDWPILEHIDNQLKGFMGSVLIDDYALSYCGVVDSLPGAADQAWHRDGDFLFGALPMRVPPHALTVFVALEDLPATSERGAPQFIPQSHYSPLYGDHAEHIARATRALSKDAGKDDEETYCCWQFDLKAGDAIIFDYRLIHRGTANRSAKHSRPLLYLVYARSWFRDTVNFGDESLSKPTAAVGVPSVTAVLNGSETWPRKDPDLPPPKSRK